MNFSYEEYSRYKTQIQLAGFGLEGQQRLKNSRVLVVGAGGLGSPVLLYLAAAGVGKLGIIDPDVVAINNLHRQILYHENQVNQSKAKIAKQQLQALNPHIDIEAYEFALDENNVETLIQEYDVIVDGSDNFATAYLINDACFHAKKPNVCAKISSWTGFCSVFTAQDGPCYRCLFNELPDSQMFGNCATSGVLASLPGILGTIQATETIKLITQKTSDLIGQVLSINTRPLTFHQYTLKPADHCPLCQANTPFSALSRPKAVCENPNTALKITVPELQQKLTQQDNFVLLDVRQPEEHAAGNLGGTLIPLGHLPSYSGQLPKDRLIVMYCRTDARSQRALAFLQSQGFTQLKYLEGGFTAWKAIEPKTALLANE